MLVEFENAKSKIDGALLIVKDDKVFADNLDPKKPTVSTLLTEPNKTPGEVLTASELALQDLKELLQYFQDNFLDKNGKFIKIKLWKYIFVKQYRVKVTSAISYLVTKVETIAGRFI